MKSKEHDWFRFDMNTTRTGRRKTACMFLTVFEAKYVSKFEGFSKAAEVYDHGQGYDDQVKHKYVHSTRWAYQRFQ